MRAPRKAACAALAALGILATSSAAASGAPYVTEFGGPADKAPSGLAAGADGRVWFASSDDPGLLSSVRPDFTDLREVQGGTVDGFPANLQPRDLTAGPDGALWAALGGGKVLRATTGGAFAVFPVGGTPAGITTGPDGHLWITDAAVPARIVELDPATGAMESYPLPDAGAAPEDIVTGPDGHLWFTEGGATPRIGRITTDGVVTEFPTPNTAGHSHLRGIAAGPDGALWFTSHTTPGRIGRITTDGQVTEFPTDVGEPSGIAAGPDGALWFVGTTDPGAVARISTAGAVTRVADDVSANKQPLWIAPGPDGNLFLTEAGVNNGKLARLNFPPAVEPPAATAVTPTTATLSAGVHARTQATTVRFEHGPTAGLGAATPELDAGAASASAPVTTTLEGLAPATTYHVRVVATNAAGATTSDTTTTFTTAPAPPVEVEPPVVVPDVPGIDLTDPEPATGRSVVVAPVDGTVRIRTRSGRYVPLGATAGLPTGAILDTRDGRLELTSRLPGGRRQTGLFWGGVFKVRQDRRTGMTQLELRGTPAGCGTKKARSAAAKRKRRPPRLWGKDSNGRFQTRGRGSVATVRGTRWLTEERCAGTYTKVTQGAVSVRDTRAGRTVLVHAGTSYVAKVGR